MGIEPPKHLVPNRIFEFIEICRLLLTVEAVSTSKGLHLAH